MRKEKKMKKYLVFLLIVMMVLAGCGGKNGEAVKEGSVVAEVATAVPVVEPTATPEPTLEPTPEPTATPEPLHLTREDVEKYRGCVVMSEGYLAPEYLAVTHPDGTVSAGVFSDLFGAESWEGIVSISCAENHVAGLKSDGTVVAVGSNSQGQLNVEGWTDIVAIATGSDFTLGLRSDGTVAVAGDCTSADAMTETLSAWEDIVAIAAAGNRVVLGLKGDGTVVYFSYFTFHVEEWTDIVAIAASEDYVAGLRSDGTVVTAVLEEYKSWINKDALKVDSWTDVQSIFTESNTTFGVQSDGTVLVAGANATAGAKALTGMEGYAYGWVLQSDGSLSYILDASLYGDGTEGIEKILAVQNIKQIDDCNYRFIALLNDGSVLVGGYPNSIVEALKNAEGNENIVQVVTGSNSLYGLKADGTMVPFHSLFAEDFSLWQGITRLNLIDNMLLGLKEDGTVMAAGAVSGIDGWDHDGHTGEYSIDRWKNIREIASDSSRYVGIKEDGTVVIGGNGADKSQGNLRSWTDIVQVDVDNPDVVGLRSDGTVVLAGTAGISEYPDGALEEIAQWQDIVKVNIRSWQYALGLKADGTVEFVWLNPYRGSSGEERIGEWTDIVDIVSSNSHTVGLRSDGTVVAIGENSAGQCDVENWENVVAIYAAYEVTVGLKADGTLCVAGNIDPSSNSILEIENVGVPTLD